MDEIERAEMMAKWAEITKKKNEGLPAQVAQPALRDGRKKGPQHKPSGISQAARELGVSRDQMSRATRIASLSPEAKAAARDHGIETQAAQPCQIKFLLIGVGVPPIDRHAIQLEI